MRAVALPPASPRLRAARGRPDAGPAPSPWLAKRTNDLAPVRCSRPQESGLRGPRRIRRLRGSILRGQGYCAPPRGVASLP
eukprot:7524764-Lingulodinium_polyedra.AAC.1